MAVKKNSSQKPGHPMAASKAICMNFCSYYKPEKAEDLACQGFIILERLMQEGRRIPLEKRDTAISPAASEMLSENVCPSCPFREDGCDFAAGRKGAAPCGGFLLLGQLIGSAVLHVDDLRNID